MKKVFVSIYDQFEGRPLWRATKLIIVSGETRAEIEAEAVIHPLVLADVTARGLNPETVTYEVSKEYEVLPPMTPMQLAHFIRRYVLKTYGIHPEHIKVISNHQLYVMTDVEFKAGTVGIYSECDFPKGSLANELIYINQIHDVEGAWIEAYNSCIIAVYPQD